ncbi:MAG: metallophosphoesterase [Chitinivibrionales bacterium]|nr:metallophosphoesterase [Chitinivibrionales bacterium]MBD3394288.1 metallophosphoesterase [Chitinivibrionales bacterium]
MKTAIISDIHANLEALQAVMDDIGSQSVDEIVCLGDVVGYGANPNECVAIVNKQCPVTILGNHDAAALGNLSTEHFNIHAKVAIEWTAEHLNTQATTFLEGLPLAKNDGNRTYVHATPYEPKMWYYITSLEEAAFNFQFFSTQFCFVGHTHIPIIIVLDKDKELYVHQEESVAFGELDNARFLINVGSVGQPRDHNPAACYGIVDSEKQVFAYRRVTYDIKKAQSKMKKIRMPEFLVLRLEEGR